VIGNPAHLTSLINDAINLFCLETKERKIQDWKYPPKIKIFNFINTLIFLRLVIHIPFKDLSNNSKY
jgi:hypothetical protein